MSPLLIPSFGADALEPARAPPGTRSFLRLEKLLTIARDANGAQGIEARMARSIHSLEMPQEQKLLFVIRVESFKSPPSITSKILKLMRLYKANTGVFIRLTPVTAAMLRYIRPYVVFGEPDLQSVRDLVFKRGFFLPTEFSTDSNNTPLDNNKIVEDRLGEHNIICVEDIVHEIATLGPAFKEVNRCLAPFALKPFKQPTLLSKFARSYTHRVGPNLRMTDLSRCLPHMI
ncbi:60S ribosomal protein L7 [Dispira simplex]|nr:60S ribosomal protein L7 [Dispira simplex]